MELRTSHRWYPSLRGGDNQGSAERNPVLQVTSLDGSVPQQPLTPPPGVVEGPRCVSRAGAFRF